MEIDFVVEVKHLQGDKKLKSVFFIAVIVLVFFVQSNINIVEGNYDWDNDGEYYFAYGDSITNSSQGSNAEDGTDCYIFQMNETYDPTNDAGHNGDGGGKTSRWGDTNKAAHYDSGNNVFVFMFGQNDLRDKDAVSETKEEYASKMMSIYNYTSGGRDGYSDSYPCLPLICATNHTYAPRNITRSLLLSWLNYTESVYESYDVKFIPMYDAIDSEPHNGRKDAFNLFYMVEWDEGGWSHPNTTGHREMAALAWFFINGDDYDETYYAGNDTIVVDAFYNQTIYIDKREEWGWANITVFCTSNDTEIGWSQGYDDTIHFEVVNGSSYEVTGSTDIHFNSINGDVNNTATLVGQRVFNWSKMPDATIYSIRISNHSNFTEVFLQLDNISEGCALESMPGGNYQEVGDYVEFSLPYAYNVTYLGWHYYQVRYYG